jgi:hypothetical protein
MTSSQHLEWAKARAVNAARAGHLRAAFDSFSADVGTRLLNSGQLSTSRAMIEWIEGFR